MRYAGSALIYHIKAVDWPADLSDRGDTLWDFFEPQRAALHSEAVAAAAGGTSRRRRWEEGKDGHGEAGEPQEDHGAFTVGLKGQTKPEKRRWRRRMEGEHKDQSEHLLLAPSGATTNLTSTPEMLFCIVIYFILEAKIDSKCRYDVYEMAMEK